MKGSMASMLGSSPLTRLGFIVDELVKEQVLLQREERLRRSFIGMPALDSSLVLIARAFFFSHVEKQN